MDEAVLRGFECILGRVDALTRITLDPGKDDEPAVTTFHIGLLEITDIERMEGNAAVTQRLKTPIPVGAFDVIVADGADEPLIRNTIVRRQYGVLKGTKEILTWDHPHVMDMRIRSQNFLDVAKPLLKGERWEDLISMTILFLTTATIDSEMSLKMLKEWTEVPTPEEKGVAT